MQKRFAEDVIADWENTLKEYPDWEFCSAPFDIQLVVDHVRYLEEQLKQPR